MNGYLSEAAWQSNVIRMRCYSFACTIQPSVFCLISFLLFEAKFRSAMSSLKIYTFLSTPERRSRASFERKKELQAAIVFSSLPPSLSLLCLPPNHRNMEKQDSIQRHSILSAILICPYLQYICKPGPVDKHRQST